MGRTPHGHTCGLVRPRSTQQVTSPADRGRTPHGHAVGGHDCAPTVNSPGHLTPLTSRDCGRTELFVRLAAPRRATPPDSSRLTPTPSGSHRPQSRVPARCRLSLVLARCYVIRLTLITHGRWWRGRAVGWVHGWVQTKPAPPAQNRRCLLVGVGTKNMYSTCNKSIY